MATKAQHYVWRGYLKRWNEQNDSKGTIFVYRKRPFGKQAQIERANLQRVGFEKYFYDMTGFNQTDITRVTQLIAYMEKDSWPKMSLNSDIFPDANAKRDFVESVMCDYENIDNRYEFLERIVKGDLAFYQDSVAQVTLDELQNAVINALFGARQDAQKLYADCLNAMNRLLDEDYVDYQYEFLRFFFMQYLRSPTRIKAQKQGLEEAKKRYPTEAEGLNENFYANSVTLFFAEKFAVNMSRNFHTWIERLDNQTDTPFVTSDTPIINVTGVEFQDKNAFYYPLSPSVAIKLCFAKKSGAYANSANQNTQLANPADIESLNRMIIDQCDNEVFADRRSVLESIA